jgi:hypothetical protein
MRRAERLGSIPGRAAYSTDIPVMIASVSIEIKRYVQVSKLRILPPVDSDVVQSSRSFRTFLRDVLPPFSGLNSEISKEQAGRKQQVHPEDEVIMFLRSMGRISPVCKASHLRRRSTP